MRNPIPLIGWLVLLLCLVAVSWVLDSFHHLVWGRLAVYLMKSGYWVFAAILFIRFLSFRSQRVFETMVDSYNRLVEVPLNLSQKARGSFYNFMFYIVLMLITSWNLVNLFPWNEKALRGSVFLDGLTWLFLMGWSTRVHWLKALGTKERLKEYLDDARSRLRTQAPAPMEKPSHVGGVPMVIVAGMAMALALGISGYRWQRAPTAFRVDDLQACMDICFRQALDSFYHQGRLQTNVSDNPCLQARRESLVAALELREGEPFLSLHERPSSDYFGNGDPGDQGLELGTDGRFRALGR